MRGQTAIPVFFRFGLKATFFLRTKKEGKDVPGASPPGPPGGLPAIFRGKPAVARLPESTIKKGCGPGVWDCCFFQPCAQPDPGGPGPPCRISSVQATSYPPIFIKRKSAGHPGCPPKRLFASFLHTEKGRGRAWDAFFAGLRFYTRTNRRTRLFQVWPVP